MASGRERLQTALRDAAPHELLQPRERLRTLPRQRPNGEGVLGGEQRPSPPQDAPGTAKEGTANPSAGLLLARRSLPNLPPPPSPSALSSHLMQWAAAAKGPLQPGQRLLVAQRRWHSSLHEPVPLPGLQSWLQTWRLGSGPCADQRQAVNRVMDCSVSTVLA